MKITLVISSLGAGGAERVMSLLAGYWAEKGWEVTLITLSGAQNDFYPLPPQVDRVGLDLLKASPSPFHSLLNSIKRLRALRRAVLASRPQVVVSFMDVTNVLTLLALKGTGLPVVVSERTDPRQHAIGLVRRLMRRLLYPGAEAVVMQTQGTGQWAAGLWPKWPVVVIPNPVELIHPSSVSRPVWFGEKNLIAVGRLVEVKRFDLLLEAFAKVAKDYPHWTLTILGDGPLRQKLEEQAKQLGLQQRVAMPGNIKMPSEMVQQADIFVLSSRFEGFPNGLVEAMALGVAPVAFDCPSGPGEIIQHEQNGLLVPPLDVDGLVCAMGRLMDDEPLRHKLAATAPAVLKTYSLQGVGMMWEKILRS